MKRSSALLAAAALAAGVTAALPAAHATTVKDYDISTLAGKVASLRGTAGLQIRFSAFLEEEARNETAAPTEGPITPAFVLSSPLDGSAVAPPDVTVNQDTAAAPQNETAIAVDPNNHNRVVAGLNDYVSRTWTCTVDDTPCSELGEGYSGTYFSHDGGRTWCCVATDPGHLGTLIPGVEHLTGGPYEAGGDPSVAWDSRGHPYYAGLGFFRDAAPNAVTVSRGTISRGHLTWSAPTFVNPTKSSATQNDKEWIAIDSNRSSPYRDRIYVTWTKFTFNQKTGHYTKSPIYFASSSDGGRRFSGPRSISDNVLYGQGSHPVVAPDGTVYVFWNGSIRKDLLNSTYFVKSTDGGATWSKPHAISRLTDLSEVEDTLFRANSYPAAAVAPNGDLYATWVTETRSGKLDGDQGCAPWLTDDLEGCRSIAVWSKSTDDGGHWTAPARVFPAANRVPVGYPVAQPSGGTLSAPSPRGPVEDVFPAVSVGPNGKAVFGAYRGTVVSPWQTCADTPDAPEGRINCRQLGDYIDNTRLDYVVTDRTTPRAVSGHPINTRHGFGGEFFGDYTDLTVGPDGVIHAFWTDSNNKQTVEWFFGLHFVPTVLNQEDVVAWNGTL